MTAPNMCWDALVSAATPCRVVLTGPRNKEHELCVTSHMLVRSSDVIAVHEPDVLQHALGVRNGAGWQEVGEPCRRVLQAELRDPPGARVHVTVQVCVHA